MGIPILAGRTFDSRDHRKSPKVAIVNQQFVRQVLPGRASGRPFVQEQRRRRYEIVGVCGDVHFKRTRLPAPATLYPLFAQAEDAGSMTFEIRSAMSLSALTPLIREAVRAVDKDLPIFDIRTQTQQIDATMTNERLFVMLTIGVRRARVDSVVGGDLRDHGAERVAQDE